MCVDFHVHVLNFTITVAASASRQHIPGNMYEGRNAMQMLHQYLCKRYT